MQCRAGSPLKGAFGPFSAKQNMQNPKTHCHVFFSAVVLGKFRLDLKSYEWAYLAWLPSNP